MIKLDKSVLLGKGTAEQARGAKIGDKDWAPPSATAKAVELDRGALLAGDDRAGAAKIGAKERAPQAPESDRGAD